MRYSVKLGVDAETVRVIKQCVSGRERRFPDAQIVAEHIDSLLKNKIAGPESGLEGPTHQQESPPGDLTQGGKKDGGKDTYSDTVNLEHACFYLGREYDLDRKTILPDKYVMYDARDLTTHGVVVGMTGSGKTGLCISLLEEAAIDGIPCIIIDPKGDLTNLLLQFPDLEPRSSSNGSIPRTPSKRG